MKRNILKTISRLFLLLLPLCILSCFQKQQEVPEPTYNPYRLKAGKYVTTKGKRINMDSVAKPTYALAKGIQRRARKSEYFPIQRYPTRIIKPKPIPTTTEVIQMKDRPSPKHLTITGEKVISNWPKWKPAQMEKETTYEMDRSYLKVEQGLIGNYIECLLEDQKGQIWIGTHHGLSVWDGLGLVTFTAKEGLYDDLINCLLEDTEGNIWIGTESGGLQKWDGTGFTHFTKELGLPSNFIRSIVEDKWGNFWIGSQERIIHLQATTKKNSFKLTDYSFFDQINTKGANLLLDSEGNINMMDHTGVYRWTPTKNGVINQYHFYKSKENLTNLKNRILEDKQGRIWFGFSFYIKVNGDTIYDIANPQIKRNLNFPMMIERNGNLWMESSNGLGILKGQEFRLISKLHTLNTTMLKSANKIWVGTISNGLFTLDLKNIGTAANTGKKGKAVGLMKAQNGEIITSLSLPNDRGITIWDGNGFNQIKSDDFYINGSILRITKDNNGNLWTGNYRNGLINWTLSSNATEPKIIQYTTKQGLSHNNVWAVLADRAGNIWAGTQHAGLSIWDGQGFTYYTTEQGLSGNRLRSLLEDRNGNIWIGSYDSGLNKWDGTAFTHFTTEEGLSDNRIQTLFEDKEGKIWIGTEEGGINVWDGTGITQYSSENGLVDDYITSLFQDVEGDIWVGTRKGLNRLQLTATDSLVHTYLQKDGIQDLSISAITSDKEDQLWIGSNKGLFPFNGNFLSSDTLPPSLSIQNLQLFYDFIDWRKEKERIQLHDHPLIGDQQLAIAEVAYDSVIAYTNLPYQAAFPYNFNQMTFQWKGIQLNAAHHIRYSYLLEGKDEFWSPLTKANEAVYMGLSAGNYTLKVRAVGRNGKWSNTANYSFTINPPWWETWWAYLLYFILIASAIYGFYRFQLSKKLAIEEGKRLQEIDHLKTTLYTNITHEFRTPLTVIQGMADELENQPQQSTKTKIGLIKKNSHKLLTMVNQMLDLSKLQAGQATLDLKQADVLVFINYLVEAHESLAKSKNHSLQFYSEEEQLLMDFDAKKLETILTNLISNAIKFSREYGKILVIAKKIKTANTASLEIEVRDKGIGIAAAQLPFIFDRFHQVNNAKENQGTGIGLALVHELVKTMKGNIRVESELDKGTTFYLSIPIQNKAAIKVQSKPQIQVPSSTLFNLEKEQVLPANELPTLLIIEDNIDVIYYLQVCLENQYQIQTSRNGKEGVEKAYELIPDIIISDVMMPLMDGFEVCRMLKEDNRTNHIPIILLTAKAHSKDKLTGLTKGADAYLIKPFEKAELLVRLENLLSIRRTLQQKYLEELNIAGQTINTSNNQPLSFIQQVEQYILTHIEEDLTVHDLARSQHLSRSQLHRKIKAVTGKSTAVYIRHLRVLKAKELLHTTDSSISEIAYQVGFKSPDYFSQIYKSTFGVAPSLEKKRKG